MIENKVAELTEEIRHIVFNWTSKFDAHISFIRNREDEYEFVTEFSLPTKLQPVPQAKVKVFFIMTDKNGEPLDVKYKFESQSLVHKLDKSIRLTQMEKYIEKILKEKELTRNVLFLGTEFEAGRTKDERWENIKDGMTSHVALELRKLNESLLSNSIDFAKSESSMDEKTLEYMKATLHEFFRGMDKNDVGVVSYEECLKILRSMEIDLSEIEMNNLMLIADKNRNGMIEYKEFIPIGSEVLYALFLKQQTKRELYEDDEMYINQAVMILYEDDLAGLSQIIINDCKNLDEDSNGYIETARLKDILNKHSGILAEKETELLFKKIESDYPKNFVYKNILDMIFKFRVDMVKSGLMENNMTKLEQYIRKLLEIFDTEKTGKLTPEKFVEALGKAEKIILTKMQMYILRSFVNKDEQGMIEYKKESKFIAELIKKFFQTSTLRKQATLLEKGEVKFDEYIKGWSPDDIKAQMNQFFITHSINQQTKLNRTDYHKLLKDMNLKLSDTEIEALIEEADVNKDGFIDQKEFETHFPVVLSMIRRNMALHHLEKIA